MIRDISQEIRQFVDEFSAEDKIILNNELIDINSNNFQTITGETTDKTIAFVDGGQAEILSAGNFCLSFIRVFAQVFQGDQKIRSCRNEFYVFTRARWSNEDLIYQSKLFSQDELLISEEDLVISSNDSSIKEGFERAPIAKVSSMARRFAELSLAGKVEADFVILDGTLEQTFRNEEKYLSLLKKNVCALAKSSSLFTVSGNSPVVLLNRSGISGCWCYQVKERLFFVKLHQAAKHVFRFEGDLQILPFLIKNSGDPLFLGYPYGLIFTDKFARVSNEEKKSLKLNFLLKGNNQELGDYLTTNNAHEILDNLS